MDLARNHVKREAHLLEGNYQRARRVSPILPICQNGPSGLLNPQQLCSEETGNHTSPENIYHLRAPYQTKPGSKDKNRSEKKFRQRQIHQQVQLPLHLYLGLSFQKKLRERLFNPPRNPVTTEEPHMNKALIILAVILIALPMGAIARNSDDSFINKKNPGTPKISGKLSLSTYSRSLNDDGISRYYLTPGPSLPTFGASHFGTKTQYSASHYLNKGSLTAPTEDKLPAPAKVSAVRTFSGFSGKLTPSSGFSNKKYVK